MVFLLVRLFYLAQEERHGGVGSKSVVDRLALLVLRHDQRVLIWSGWSFVNELDQVMRTVDTDAFLERLGFHF